MSEAELDRPNRIHWPPILYAIVLLWSWAFRYLWALPPIIVRPASVWIGGVLCLIGLLIGAAGLVHFRRVGTAFDPTSPASVLATGGIYTVTRNPMYLGALLLFSGLGIAWPNTWLLLILPILAVALRKLAIEREEAYLERRFGDAYLAYKHRVRRWI